jgi:hypothetical protein
LYKKTIVDIAFQARNKLTTNYKKGCQHLAGEEIAKDKRNFSEIFSLKQEENKQKNLSLLLKLLSVLY